MNKITTDKSIVASVPSKKKSRKRPWMALILIKPSRGPHVDEAMVEVVKLTPMLFRKAV